MSGYVNYIPYTKLTTKIIILSHVTQSCIVMISPMCYEILFYYKNNIHEFIVVVSQWWVIMLYKVYILSSCFMHHGVHMFSGPNQLGDILVTSYIVIT